MWVAPGLKPVTEPFIPILVGTSLGGWQGWCSGQLSSGPPLGYWPAVLTVATRWQGCPGSSGPRRLRRGEAGEAGGPGQQCPCRWSAHCVSALRGQRERRPEPHQPPCEMPLLPSHRNGSLGRPDEGRAGREPAPPGASSLGGRVV